MRKTLSAHLAALALFLAVSNSALAIWPVELTLTNQALSRPVIGPDSNAGAIIAGSSLTGENGFDLCLFRVDSSGTPIWSEETAINWTLPFDQYPIEVAYDGNGRYLALIEDWPAFPPVDNRLWLVSFEENGQVSWSSTVRDSLTGTASQATLTIAADEAVVVWHDDRSDSAGAWYQCLDLDSGQKRNGEQGSYLTNAFFHDEALAGENLLLACGNGVYQLNLVNHQCQLLHSGQTLSLTKLLVRDQLFVCGRLGNSLILECFDGESLVWTDTVCSQLTFYTEVEMVSYQNGLAIGFLVDYEINCRYWFPEGGLSEPLLICPSENNQSAMQLQTGSDCLSFAWYENRAGRKIFIQHLADEDQRWNDGYQVGEINTASPSPPLDACAGGNFGLMVWAWNGSFQVQPIDSMPTTDATTPTRPTELSFKLNPCYPNPVNGTVNIEYQLAKAQTVQLTVVNLLGQEVAQLINQWQPAGSHLLRWQPIAASGKYFVVLANQHATVVQPLTVIR